MKLQIESTTEITQINGLPIRVWKGVTENGAKCFAFVYCVAVHPMDCSEFEKSPHLVAVDSGPPRMNITSTSLLQSGAFPDKMGRYSWPPIVDRDGVTHLSVVPAGDGWMLEISQRDKHDSPEPHYPTGIGFPVTTMAQLLTLVQAIRGSLQGSTAVDSRQWESN